MRRRAGVANAGWRKSSGRADMEYGVRSTRNGLGGILGSWLWGPTPEAAPISRPCLNYLSLRLLRSIARLRIHGPSIAGRDDDKWTYHLECGSESQAACFFDLQSSVKMERSAKLLHPFSLPYWCKLHQLILSPLSHCHMPTSVLA